VRAPGRELVHLDVKLGRIEGGAGKRVRGGSHSHDNRTFTDRAGKRRNTVGWEYVHIAVDDHSRLAYAELLGDEKAATAAAFLQRALAHYRRYGIRVERILTDNGSCYLGAVHALACRALGIRHSRTRPYRPQTNGKTERFIRTLSAGWAYGAIYRSSAERSAARDGWPWHYNHRRRHSALGRQAPITRTTFSGLTTSPRSRGRVSVRGVGYRSIVPAGADRRSARRGGRGCREPLALTRCAEKSVRAQ
jgi:transposase InsO family protein